MRQPTGKFLTSAAGPFMMPMMLVMIPLAIIYAMFLAVWVTGRMVYLVGMELRRQVRNNHRKPYRRYAR